MSEIILPLVTYTLSTLVVIVLVVVVIARRREARQRKRELNSETADR